MQLYGGIEAGGTKFICAVAEHPTAAPIETVTLPTTTPESTIAETIAFFKRHPVKSLGIGSFGPVDLNPRSSTFGYITTTPKPGWQYTDLVSPLKQALNVPIGFEHDVSVAALGEWRYGAAQGADSMVYVTVGTGIGGCALIDSKLLHGLMHSEMGHILLKRHADDTYAGHCPFHQDCLEGMACGPAIAARWGSDGAELPPDHKAWEVEAYYLAQLVCTILYTISPQRIVLGGGVMHQRQLFPLIHRHALELLNGYLSIPPVTEHMDTLVIPPGLGDRSGAVGALELARLATV
jgi:fructokinase